MGAWDFNTSRLQKKERQELSVSVTLNHHQREFQQVKLVIQLNVILISCLQLLNLVELVLSCIWLSQLIIIFSLKMSISHEKKNEIDKDLDNQLLCELVAEMIGSGCWIKLSTLAFSAPLQVDRNFWRLICIFKALQTVLQPNHKC